ncbi:MAG TPA: hypothetical protein DCS93_31490 [Microscillaceae bacterium]|nr:hypothetical protein [Microscillaceae bacterium]
MHTSKLKGNEAENSQNQVGQISVQRNKQSQIGEQRTSQDAKPTSTIQAKQRPVQAKHKPIQAKHKPIQAKHKPIQAKHKPIQRQGKEKSAEIAKSLGQKHNVDTSNLEFNHNSSFPESVNAEATIQGNKIDFAPNKDTTENIKHEVGHHIINTKRGTVPKADSVVNGHAVNTTDETAADKIMNESLPTQQGESMQMKASNTSSNGTPIQRVRVQDSGTGNVHDTEAMLADQQQGIEAVVELAMRFLIMHNIDELDKIRNAHQANFLAQGYDISDEALWQLSGLRKQGKVKKQSNDSQSDDKSVDDKSSSSLLANKYQGLKSYNPESSYGYKASSGKDSEKSPLMPGGDMDNHRLMFAYILDQVEQDYQNDQIPDYIAAEKGNDVVQYQSVSDGYRKTMNKLIHTQRLAQQAFGSEGIKVVARFYVEDEQNGIKYPGLNSWASVKGYDAKNSSSAEVAYKHMKKGHDVGSGSDSLQASPFVSTTGNLSKLLMADSPFNAHNKQQAAMNQGQYYSERIDRLVYGYGTEQENQENMDMGAVANKIAFLAVNTAAYGDDDRKVFTSANIDTVPEDCCTLEDEHVLFAPQELLQDIILGVQDNPLPGVHNVQSAANKKQKLKQNVSALSHFGLNRSDSLASIGHASSLHSMNSQGSFYDDSGMFENDAVKSKESLSNQHLHAGPIKHSNSSMRLDALLNAKDDDIHVNSVIESDGVNWIVTKTSKKHFQAYKESDETKSETKFRLKERGKTWTLKE